MEKRISQHEKEMIGRGIQRVMQEEGLTPKELAKRSKLPLARVSQLLNGQDLWLDDEDLRKLVEAFPSRLASRGISPQEHHDLTHEDLMEFFIPRPPDEPPSTQFKLGL